MIDGIGVCELVGVGHPDKAADYVADFLLDSVLLQDRDARAGFEVMISGDYIFVGGEYTAGKRLGRAFFKAKILEALRDIYPEQNPTEYKIHLAIHKQSREIIRECMQPTLLIPDQGIACGYATNETDTMLPVCQEVGQRIARWLMVKVADWNSASHCVSYSNDFKLLITCEEGVVKNVTCSIKHGDLLPLDEVRGRVKRIVISPILGSVECEEGEDLISVNPGGVFVMGNHSDTGVTNRKIICDNYGCGVEHGGGGYSGKDLTKPDRLLGYYARYIAVNAVRSNLCTWCRVKIVYSYAESQVRFFEIDSDSDVPLYLADAINVLFDLPYSEIYEKFRDFPCFSLLAKYGHFGISRSVCNPPWEEWDKAMELRELANKFMLDANRKP